MTARTLVLALCLSALPAEASAAATEGAQESKLFDFGKIGMGALYGAGIGLVVGLVAQLAKGGRKAAKPAPPPDAGSARPTGRPAVVSARPLWKNSACQEMPFPPFTRIAAAPS